MININLIAERRAKKLQEMKILYLSVGSVLVILLAMIAGNVFAWNRLTQCRTAVAEATKYHEELTVKRIAYQKILEDIAWKDPVIKLLDQVRLSEGAWMIILNDICQVIPHDAVVNNLAVSATNDGVQLRFSGIARDETTVGTFMQTFRQQTRWAGLPVLMGVNSIDLAPGMSYTKFDFLVPVKGLYGGDL